MNNENEISAHLTITRDQCVALFQVNQSLFDYDHFRQLYFDKVKARADVNAQSSFSSWGVFYIELQRIFVEVEAEEEQYHIDKEEDAATEAYQAMCDSGELYYRSVTTPDMWGEY